MQQAIMADKPFGGATGTQAPPAAPGNAYVINLVSSTTPVALVRPDHAGLRRFTFFVSRRLEEGRERFRLHMGFFETQEEAEKLLDIVRTIYPGAWAGAAPGRRLGAPASMAVSAEAQAPAAAPTPAVTPSPAVARAATPSVSASESASVPVSPAPVAAVVASPPPGVAKPQAAAAAHTRPAVAAPAAPRPAAAAGAAAPASATPAIAAKPRTGQREAAAVSLTNVRDAIASLEDQAGRSPSLPALRPAVIPTLRPAAMPAPSGSAARAPGAASGALTAAPLSDAGVLQLLESEPAATARMAPAQSRAGADPRADKPYYAVQLVWSVQPIAMSQIPQLAIFGAYTLYGAEGNRGGRRWYGLRLGFFTDAVSAKQVAHYVRGDFSTVSVVPVTVREREQALAAAQAAAHPAGGRGAPTAQTARTPGAARTTGTARTAGAGAASGARAQQAPAFEFIDDNEPLQIRTATATGPVPQAAQPPTAAGAAPMARAPRPAPGKRAKVRNPGQVQARAHVRAKTLEETLEILGANLLEIERPGDPVNDSGVRHLQLKTAKSRSSKLGRLLERLAERGGEG